MTLIVNIATYEGIVIASDSKQIQTERNNLVRASENITKIFPINDKVVVSLAGLAFFNKPDGKLENVADYITDYAKTVKDNTSIETIANELYNYILQRYPLELQQNATEENIKAQVAMMGDELISIQRQNDSIKFKARDPQGNIKEGICQLQPVDILIAGYNENNETEIFELTIPGTIQQKRQPNDYGGTWVGQGDVVARLILGYDGRIFANPFFQQKFQGSTQQEIQQQLGLLEYKIPWSTLPLQDAIELAVFLIKTTATIQKYTDSIIGDDHQIAAVGGPIDVVVITPNDKVKWINKKQLHYPDNL